jgi:hypothetical protein
MECVPFAFCASPKLPQAVPESNPSRTVARQPQENPVLNAPLRTISTANCAHIIRIEDAANVTQMEYEIPT